MTNKIEVLPGSKGPGFVRLVSYMQPAPNFDPLDNPEYGGSAEDIILDSRKNWTGDLEVVRNARVSFDADWRTGEDDDKDAKLLNYMMKNKHTSPFEAVVFTFEIKAPIFIFRQWHRHRTWSYNEISARYAELDEGFYIPEPNKITTQSKSNKQARTADKHPQAEALQSIMEASNTRSFVMYKTLLDEGCPRELARSVLPVASYSRMFATVDLHNLLHFLRLRLHSHAQYEIRVYAEALLVLISPIVPITAKAFRKTL